jgi:hypothetical protein
MKKAIFFYLTVLMAVAGCTSKSVETVKQTASENKNFTIGEVLGFRTFCDKTKWSVSKSDAGDTIVEYSCRSTIGRDVTDALKQSARENIEGKAKYMADRFLSEEEKAEIAYRSAQSYQSEADASASRLAQQIQELSELKAEPLEGRTAEEKRSIESGIWQMEKRVVNSQANDKSAREGYAKQLADATTAKQRIAAMKEAYFAGIQTAKAADLEAIDKLYPEPSKIEQKVFFVVDGDRSKVVRLEFYVDGKRVEAEPYRQLFIFRSELTAPKGPKPLADWKEWWSRMVGQRYKSQMAELEGGQCYGSLDCIDPQRTEKSSTGS